MILKNALLAGLFSGLCFSLSAQSGEFVAGGFVTVAGDTTRGFILDRPINSQHDRFLFKTSPKELQAQEYTPDQVEYFFYAPAYRFRALPVHIENQSTRKFVRQLVTGSAELYEYNSGVNPVYLLTVASGKPVQLEKRDTIVDGKVKSDRRYEGLIRYALRDCKQLIVQGGRLEFNQGMLSQYVRRYNRCVQPEETSAILVSPRKLRISVGLTGGISHVRSSVTNYNAAWKDEPSTGQGRRGGIPVDIYFFERLGLQTGAIYHQYDFTHSNSYSLGTDRYHHQFRTIEIPVNARYQLTTGKIRPYLYGGFKLPIFMEKTLTHERIQLSEPATTEQEEMQFSTVTLFNGGIGVAIKAFGPSDIHLNLGFDHLNAEFRIPDARTIQNSTLLLSGALMF